MEMKVILEFDYKAAECSIVSMIALFGKIGIYPGIFKIERQTGIENQKEKNPNVIYTVAFIKKIICMVTEMPEEIFESSSRHQEVVENRQMAMYLCRQYTRKSLREIGMEFGNKTPATIMHACKAISNLSQTDKKFQEKLAGIERILISGVG